MKLKLLPVLLLLALPAQAAVFRVTKTADTLDGICDRDCSLREAILAANGRPGTDVVLAGPGVYTLAAALSDLDVRSSMVILGAGPDRTILDGGGTHRVLDVLLPRFLDTFELHGVTVRNGHSDGDGGGIRAGGRLAILRNCVITGNSADGAGGGIAADALDLRDSTVAGNRAFRGGGIYAFDELTVENVTVSQNHAEEGGGGLGYAALVRSITHATVTGNSAAFGGGVAVVGNPNCPDVCVEDPRDQILARSVVAGNTADEGTDCWGENSEGENVIGVIATKDFADCATAATDRAGTPGSPLDARLTPLADHSGHHGGPTPTHGLLPGSPALDLASSWPAADQRGFARAVDGDHDGVPEGDAGAFEAVPGCEPSPGTLCLGNRFQVTVRWTAQGGSGDGEAIPLAADTGAFWFFGPENVELMVKVLNGCALNQRVWVFLSGLTDVQVDVTVVDSLTGERWEHHHAGGAALPTLLDTDALAVCSATGPAVGGTPVSSPLPGFVHRVTKTADTFDVVCDRDCSLREAVAAANQTIGGAAVVLGPGVYTLTRAGRGEEVSGTGDLDVQGNLLLLGAGADRTILDGGGIDRVLHVRPLGSLDLQGVTVRNGWAQGQDPGGDGKGGGILAEGFLRIEASAISGNRADRDGGGIVAPDLTVLGSTVSGNQAGRFAGGIRGGPSFHLTNSTVSGNQAPHGGGVAVLRGNVEIDQATITGNAAEIVGGLLLEGFHCIPEDPACFGPHPSLNRSILAGNSATAGFPDCFDLVDNPGGHNLFGVADQCFPDPTDQVGIDPLLSPLGDHGGPTPTHLPLAGSPAIDAGGATCVAADQRGAARPAPGGGQPACDAGAVEATSACVPGPTRLCLQDGRFAVTVHWTAQGNAGPGRTVPLAADTGAFWFFDAANLEMMVKVLDGCSLNGRYWVFVSGLTDVALQILVQDTRTGTVWSFGHVGGSALQPLLDTSTLGVCP